jgi:hypothetical protein
MNDRWRGMINRVLVLLFVAMFLGGLLLGHWRQVLFHALLV